MDCELAQQQILMADDPAADVAASAALSAHVKECQACAELLARTQKVAVGTKYLPAGPKTEPSEAFLAKVRQAAKAPAETMQRWRPPHRLWMPRAAAAALIVAIGLLALSLCLFNSKPARGDMLLSELVQWNLQLSQANGAKARAELYQAHVDQMEKRVKEASLTQAERALAEKMLTTAKSQSSNDDPLDNAARLEQLVDQVAALPSGGDPNYQKSLEQMQAALSTGMSTLLGRVTPATLSPSDQARYQALTQKLRQLPPAPSSTPDHSQNSAGGPRMPTDPVGGLGFGPGRLFENPRRNIVVTPGMDMHPDLLPPSAPVLPLPRIDPLPNMAVNPGAGRGNRGGGALPGPNIPQDNTTAAGPANNTGTPATNNGTTPNRAVAQSPDPDGDRDGPMDGGPGKRNPVAPPPGSGGGRITPPAYHRATAGGSGGQKDVPEVNDKEVDPITDPTSKPIFPMPFSMPGGYIVQSPDDLDPAAGDGSDKNGHIVADPKENSLEDFNFQSNTSAIQILVDGTTHTLNLNGQGFGWSFTPSASDDSGGEILWHSFVVRSVVTPEPSTLFVGAALAVLALRRSRKPLQ